MRMQAGGTHKSADGVMPVKHVVVKEQLTTAALFRKLASRMADKTLGIMLLWSARSICMCLHCMACL